MKFKTVGCSCHQFQISCGTWKASFFFLFQMFGLIWTSDSGVNEDKTNRHFLVSIMMAVQQALIPEHCHIKLNNALATMQCPPSPPTALSLALFWRIHWDPRPSQSFYGPIDLQFQLRSVSVQISAKRPASASQGLFAPWTSWFPPMALSLSLSL